MTNKLLTNEIIKTLPALYSTEEQSDPIALVRFFHSFSSWEWFLIEFDPVQRLCFGLVNGFKSELGYFSLTELESLEVLGCGIERDTHFKPVPVSVAKAVVHMGY